MEKEFVPYEESLELKELGFNEPCFGLYAPPSKTVFLHHYGLLSAKEQILAPTFSQAFRFFREKYNHCGWVQESYFKGRQLYQYHISRIETLSIISNVFEGTFEEAELACLKKLIEIVKTK